MKRPPAYALPDHIGGYRVLGRISKGGMGEVLLAAREGQHGFNKRVAIKVVLPHLVDDEAYKTMFFDEARLASRLSHPNVCQVFDFGEDQGVWYLVMEYVDGVPLERLRQLHAAAGTRVPPQLAALLIAQAARGLHHAHNLVGDDGQPLHVVHRDVSPQNLLVTYDGCCKVLDFGIARSRGRERVTQMGVVRGKPGYMAPEQTVGEELDARTDIFQLGIVMWELLTSEELFVRENIYHSVRAVMEELAPDVREKVPGIDDGYQHVLGQALAKDKRERFSNAEAFARALDEVINRTGRPVTDAVLAEHVRAVAPRPVPTADPAMSPELLDQLPTLAEDAPVRPHGRASDESTQVLGSATGRPEDRATAVIAKAPARAPAAAPADLKVIVHDEQSVSERIGQPSTAAYLLSLGRRRRAPLLVAAGLLTGLLLVVVAVAIDGASQPAKAPIADVSTTGSEPVESESESESESAPAPEPEPEPEPESALQVETERQPTRRRRPPRDKPPAAPVEPAPSPPAVQPDPPAPAQAGHGLLRVTKAGAYANVRVDGELLGSTPILGHRVTAGEHLVEVLAAASGEVLLRRTVNVIRERTARVHVP